MGSCFGSIIFHVPFSFLLVKLVNEIIRDFENPKSDETIIPVHWLDERPKVGILLPFCRKHTLAQQRATSKFVLMNIQMLISSRSQPSTSENTQTTSSRGKF